MKTIHAIATCVAPLAIACSSSSSTAAPDLTKFTGAPWSGSVAVTIVCGGASNTQNYSYSVTFAAQGPGITTTTGCTLDFSVSGDTATLLYENTLQMDSLNPSAGTPECLAHVGDAGVETFIYQGGTFATPDGHMLTGELHGSMSFYASIDAGPEACTFSYVISATR
jgi:hypothetical protein